MNWKKWGIYGQRTITDVLLFRQQREAFLVSGRNRRWWAAKIEVVLCERKPGPCSKTLKRVFRAYTLWGFLLRLCPIRLFWSGWWPMFEYNQFADQKILSVPLKMIDEIKLHFICMDLFLRHEILISQLTSDVLININDIVYIKWANRKIFVTTTPDGFKTGKKHTVKMIKIKNKRLLG